MRVPVRHVMAAALAAGLIGVVTVVSLAVTPDQPVRMADLQDVVLKPAPRAVVAEAVAAPARAVETSTAGSRGPVETAPRAGIRRVSASSSRNATRAADATATKTRRTKTDPLAALRGGTRGIPFALPPG
jgi:hypothetical protein